MPSFLAKIDKFNRIMLKESTNNQAEAAANDLLQLLQGVVKVDKSKNDDTVIYIGSNTSSDYITIKVIGYKDTLATETEDAAPAPPSRVLPPRQTVEEDEEVTTDIETDPVVIQAKEGALQKIQKSLAGLKQQAAQRLTANKTV